MIHTVESNIKPDYDAIFEDIADYVLHTPIESPMAYDTARWCLLDTLGCGILALGFPECKKLLGPIVPGAQLPGGARVPGTAYELDPIQAAFNIGTMVRWLDFNDTWLAAEWGHPSDNLGAILAVADYMARQKQNVDKEPLRMQQVLTLMIKAHEIQGCMALENSFNRVGLDHVILVKLASAAVVCVLLGGDRDMLLRTLSQVFVDGQALRTYRHAPNAGSRKSWAAGDATARAVRLALWSQQGEMGYPSALTAPRWGFYDVSFGGQTFRMQRPYGSYVMEHVLFKISYPAEFHAQTAVECAAKLYPDVKDRWDEIATIEMDTHESAIRIISKEGALHNPADRDHCLQYMVAVALLWGDLKAEHYEDDVAADPRIDTLRAKMHIKEDLQFSKDYHAPELRSIANRIKITFQDGSKTESVTVEYPIGHPRRREEGLPVLLTKARNNLLTHYAPERVTEILNVIEDQDKLMAMPVVAFMDLWCE
ncbi:MAG: bifunctional 2-methylcitrate dehydratase/aconitate hydratase [Gammaproteobacteria bacterium]|nr:bifunctional 2-methylcitrate dehydratase/aconitate hydratase [Gammaproteobacteria bacterium]